VFSRIGNCAILAILFYFLFFYGLTSAGLVGPDEPRYASIGREMARTGDWLTPKLWGKPWFEKPPLLYWMAGCAFRLGLGEELAPRLPSALVSAAFIVFFFFFLRSEFGGRAAWFAAAILATSAGWLAYSHACATDMPMAAMFAAGMLFAMPWAVRGDGRGLIGSGALFGLAVLAKGLVPLVLAAPVLFLGIRRLWEWRRAAVVFSLVAVPWYAFSVWKHGRVFVNEFFLRHHFERFAADSLQHVQPFWFYLPVLVGALFPWSGLLALIFQRRHCADARTRFFLWWAGWGLVFFSAATNKLPGYILPLLPPLAALMGIGLSEARRASLWAASAITFLSLTPLVAAVFPAALASGLSRATIPWNALWLGAPLLLLAAVAARTKASQAFLLASAAAVAAVIALKTVSLPEVDRVASARPLWKTLARQRDQVCVGRVQRAWRYGLNYYSVLPLPDCMEQDLPLHLEAAADGRPVVQAASSLKQP